MNNTLNKIRKVLYALVVAFIGWPLYALIFFVPRNSGKYVFGVYSATFSGNVKALFFDSQFAPGCRKVLLYKDKSIQVTMDSMPDSAQYIYYSVFSFRGIYHALSAKYYVYSNYLSDISFWFSSGATVFNVWHGTPLKNIERDVHVGQYSKKNKWQWFLKYIFPSFYVTPNKILVCSDYEKACFKSAFAIKDESAYVCSFPPRLTKVKQKLLTSEKNIILYCPTWRDDGSFAFQEEVNIDNLNQLMIQMNLTFVIKPHQSDKSLYLPATFSNVVLESNLADVYDLLPSSVALITDYSSMLFDAVYCEIPTILFCPDLGHYQNKNRGFYTPIHSLGLPVATSENQLFESIQNMRESAVINHVNECFTVYENKSVQL